MSRVFTDPSTREALSAAARSVEDGDCVVLPTDTVYGVGARPDDPQATGRIFELKRRPRELTLPVLVGGAEDVPTVAEFDERAARLAERYWPGALTLVLPRTATSAGWDLGAERDTIGVRVPDHPVAAALLARTGPLAVTSANLSGRPTAPSCAGVRRDLGDGVAVYLCHDAPVEPVPSTVVALIDDEPAILRSGALGAEQILGTVRGG